MSFKEFIHYLKHGPTQKGSMELKEMAMWKDVLELTGSDSTLYSKITPKDNFIKKIRELDLFINIENNNYYFKLSYNNIVFAYLKCTKTDFKIDGREALVVELSRRCNELKNHRYGLELYKYVLKHHVLMCDIQVSAAACKVWMNIFNDPLFENGIFDTKLKKVVDRNIHLIFKDGRIWKDFEITKDKLLDKLTGKLLDDEEEEIALYRRVFAYKK